LLLKPPAISPEIFWICDCTSEKALTLSSFCCQSCSRAGAIAASCSLIAPEDLSGCNRRYNSITYSTSKLGTRKKETYNAISKGFFSKRGSEAGEFSVSIRQGLEKLGSRFGSLLDFFLVNAKTLLLYLEKEFVSFLVALTNFIPYFL